MSAITSWCGFAADTAAAGAGSARPGLGVGVVCLGFALCNLCYIWLPVVSPSFLYPLIGAPMSNGFFLPTGARISNRGGCWAARSPAATRH